MPEVDRKLDLCQQCGASLNGATKCPSCGASYEVTRKFDTQEIFQKYPGLKNLHDAGQIKVEQIGGELLRLTGEKGGYVELTVAQIDDLKQTKPFWTTDLAVALMFSEAGIQDAAKIMESLNAKLEEEVDTRTLSNWKNLVKRPIMYMSILKKRFLKSA
jgi:hypothetical protein